MVLLGLRAIGYIYPIICVQSINLMRTDITGIYIVICKPVHISPNQSMATSNSGIAVIVKIIHFVKSYNCLSIHTVYPDVIKDHDY